ncbi:MAG: S8 family serine peptidase [Leptolyngbya sp. SIO4C1]|nr:S8 family serine peptidase [Leptolyngbya sp. SIO4C1]
MGDSNPDALAVDHGTSVLSIVAGVNNQLGGIGIAPNVETIRLASHYSASQQSSGHVADAITAIRDAGVLNPGDVLLLEVQRDTCPVETDPADFDAIRLASSADITVVEAAGNGGYNLDTGMSAVAPPTPENPNLCRLNPLDPDFEDSGAIMVAAAFADPPHPRYVDCGKGCDSNYGHRINCYAWGELILAAAQTGAAGLGPYDDNFGGTSGAAAIIAGVALVVQGLHRAAHGGASLSNVLMRSRLSDPALGTISSSSGMGVMPDLRQIVPTVTSAPIVAMRKLPIGLGGLPCGETLGLSPDIIVRPERAATPAVDFGEGSGTEHSNQLSAPVVAKQDQFVYVRVRNRGNEVAKNVRATVYYSEATPLPTAAQWQKIGTSKAVTLEPHSCLTVLPAIAWSAERVPTAGAYTFIAVITSGEEPLPSPPDNTLQAAQRFLQRSNAAILNLSVVETRNSSVSLPFTLFGDSERSFTLSFQLALPEQASVLWTLPKDLFERLPETCFDKVQHQQDDRITVRFPDPGGLSLANIQLPDAKRYETELVIQSKFGRGHYAIAVRQFIDTQEIGRLTWQLQPPRPRRPFRRIFRLLRFLR